MRTGDDDRVVGTPLDERLEALAERSRELEALRRRLSEERREDRDQLQAATRVIEVARAALDTERERQAERAAELEKSQADLMAGRDRVEREQGSLQALRDEVAELRRSLTDESSKLEARRRKLEEAERRGRERHTALTGVTEQLEAARAAHETTRPS